ncbi:hypothetical protein FHETE_5520 [Fusarium heterosporum]|uniref:Uncharacterized protein n=1 Tax=Fusarium heterosporum TaxID=42747 RepID=A0A8H5WR38_FUSHE|nr:hypothetical protein FHETE_5520 [Fusarium heterosporum]
MQLPQERSTVPSSEDARGGSSRSCLVEPQTVCIPQASKKRKRKGGEEEEKGQPTAKRRNAILKKIQSDPPEDNVKKASGEPISEAGLVPAHVSNFPEISSTPFDSPAPDPSKTYRSDTERLFGVEDVEAGAAILAVIADICNDANGKLSRAEQLELRSMFDQMPKLLTHKQRDVDPEKAYKFLFAIYESSVAGNWEDIGALNDLETKLELLQCFDSRAEASPKRKGDVYVV